MQSRAEKTGGIRQTRNGLILMMIAAMTLWIPYVQYAGYALEIAGAAMLMHGRKAVGQVHSRNVTAAFYLFVLATVAQTAMVAYALLAPPGSALGGNSQTHWLLLLDYGPVFLSMITGLIFVIPMISLESEGGQSLLWIAFGSGVLLGLLSTLGGGELLFSGVPGLFGHLFAGMFEPSLLSITIPPFYYLGWGMLTVIPFGLFAFGIYLALRRLDRFLPNRLSTMPLSGTE